MQRNKKIVVAIIIVLCLSLWQWICIMDASKRAEDNEIEPVYFICDVYDAVYNGNQVEIDITLPNGELLTRNMSIDDDLPEGFAEVIIQATDLDDYSTYKIVGMR